MPDIEVKRTYNDVINRKSEQQGKKADVPSDLLARMEPILKLFSSITNTASAEEIPIAYRRQIDNFQQLTELSKAYLNKLEDKKAREINKKLLTEKKLIEKTCAIEERSGQCKIQTDKPNCASRRQTSRFSLFG